MVIAVGHYLRTVIRHPTLSLSVKTTGERRSVYLPLTRATPSRMLIHCLVDFSGLIERQQCEPSERFIIVWLGCRAQWVKLC